MLPCAWNPWWAHRGEPGASSAAWLSGRYRGPWGTLSGDVTMYYHLLPFLEQNAMYQAGSGQQLFSYVSGTRIWTIKLKTFKAPNDPSPRDDMDLAYSWLESGATTQWACTSYGINYQVFGVRGGNAWDADQWGTTLKIDTIPDGSSNTIFLAEKLMYCQASGNRGNLMLHGGWDPQLGPYFAGISGATAKFQTGVTQQNCNHTLAHAYGASGLQVAMGDGSVRSVSAGVSNATWANAVDPMDGLVLGSDW